MVLSQQFEHKGEFTLSLAGFTDLLSQGYAQSVTPNIGLLKNARYIVSLSYRDTAGNPSYLVLTLKSVGEQSLSQSVDDTHDDLNDGEMKESTSSELESENNLLRIGFLVLAVLLFIVVILMLVKNREPKTPEGLPNKAEDRWADRFVG